jgi:hypothetical protein
MTDTNYDENDIYDEVFDDEDELIPMLPDSELLAYWGIDITYEPPSETSEEDEEL